jgi:hypothetical protein
LLNLRTFVVKIDKIGKINIILAWEQGLGNQV